MNGDKPELVVLSYDNYLKLDRSQPVMSPVVNEKVLEDLNKEILALKEEIRQKEEAELVSSLDEDDTIAGAIDLS